MSVLDQQEIFLRLSIYLIHSTGCGHSIGKDNFTTKAKN